MQPVLIVTPASSPSIREGSLIRSARRAWRALVPVPVREQVQALRRKFRAWHHRRRTINVPIQRLLLGDQGRLTASRFAQQSGRLLHPSTPLVDSPYTQFLREYDCRGDQVLSECAFQQTSYYQFIAECFRVQGAFGIINRKEDIQKVARRFLDDYLLARRQTQSAALHHGCFAPIELRPIAHSDCMQIIDGHHRAAIARHCGLREVPAFITGPAVLTPLQAVLLDCTWLGGRRELYQPVDAPELRKEWLLVRGCADRLAMMNTFLQDQGLLSSGRLSYLDLGSAYGWFVKRMSELGFEASGVDQDLPAIFVGVMAYGLEPSQVFAEDLVEFLRQGRQYDVVSCLSVLHNMINAGPEELVQLLGQTTRRVLFLETGGAHENWHGGALAEWTDDYIEELLRRQTSFRQVHRLGKDADGVGPFEGSYNRTLFACLRE